MDRRLGAPAGAPRWQEPGDAIAANVEVERKNSQIVPLGEEPYFQTLTPRTLAKSVAELGALRTRVQELEQKLAERNEVELLLAQKSVSKRLPPLEIGEGGANGPGSPSLLSASPIGIRSVGELRAAISNQGYFADRLATAPECSFRGQFSPLRKLAAIDSAPIDMAIGPEREELENALSSDGDTLPLSTIEEVPSTQSSTESPSSSPPKEQAKISLSHEGDATFAFSQRNRLYQIMKRLSALITFREDDVSSVRWLPWNANIKLTTLGVFPQLLILKKLVDAEFGDVITFLLDVETETDIQLISDRLEQLLKNGSPSKLRSHVKPEFPRQHPVWGIQYPLQKIAQNLEEFQGTPPKTEVVVLVSSGAFNPIHMLHVRAFYVARQYVESNYKYPVVGAFISPSHDTYVRVKNRRNPREMITRRHRLALIEAAVASSSWIEVDKWEITRRRVLDYLSTLNHVREMCESHFPQFKFRLMYVCGVNTVVKLSHSALREEGFGCICICRPSQTDMVTKHLGKQLVRSTIIVEDTGVLPCELERATSFRVRQALASADKNAAVIEMMVGKPVFQYLLKFNVGGKIAGRENWTEEDKQWRDIDLPYVEYAATMLTVRDASIVATTVLAVLVYQNGARYYAAWKGKRARELNPLIPAQITTEESTQDTCADGVPRRIKKAETVLRRRTARIVLVLESSCDTFNQQAVIRTAECMGIQHVWIVDPAFYKKHKDERRISREATDWLTIRHFKTSETCIQELLSQGYDIWATDLSQDSVSLEEPGLELPERVAIVMGRESDGVSKVMLEAAHRRVYLPIHGFADSLNLNVATGMVLQALFYMCPEARGAMPESERTQLRDTWYRRLVKGKENADVFLANPPAPFLDLRRPNDHRAAWMGNRIRRRLLAKEQQLREQFNTQQPEVAVAQDNQ
uniref:Cytidyltransferase-like domain-containing protein n=1 Tax=Lagenidium giganteum TaxID=4803 RepID=A0AAV2ZAR8_9STRA